MALRHSLLEFLEDARRITIVLDDKYGNEITRFLVKDAETSFIVENTKMAYQWSRCLCSREQDAVRMFALCEVNDMQTVLRYAETKAPVYARASRSAVRRRILEV